MQQKITEIGPVDKLVDRSREFLRDWALFGKIVGSYPGTPPEQRGQLEIQFLHLKSKLAREHEVLKNHMGPDFKYDPNTVNILSGSTSLESIYSQSEVAVKKVQGEWHRAFISINETQGIVDEKRARILKGERVNLGNMDVKLKKPLPWKQIFIGIGATAAIVLLVATLYIMRNFLGFWAPEAGEGIEVTETMSDEERISTTMSMMISAFDSRNIDRMMTGYADEFQDDEGRGKTALRAFLQTAKTSGDLDGIYLQMHKSEIKVRGDEASIGPVTVVLPDDDPFDLQFDAKRFGDRWLITGARGFE